MIRFFRKKILRATALAVFGIGLLAASAPVVSAAYVSPGASVGYVNDFAQVMTDRTRLSLESELQGLKQRTGHEVAVVTVTALQDDTIEDYANHLFREWGIGQKAQNDGVLFLIAINDRKMRIEVGYGLEGTLTDVQAQAIIDDQVKPWFQQQDYNQGIIAGTRSLEQALGGTATDTPKPPKPDGGFSDLLFFFLIGPPLIFFGGLSRLRFGKKIALYVPTLILSLIFIRFFVSDLFQIFLFGLLSVVISAILLLFGLFNIGMGIGRGSGGWGGGGGGGGGFGGGSSGGGGASGSW